MTELSPAALGKVSVFAGKVFKRIAEDFRVLLPHPIVYLEGELMQAGWPQIVKHFEPMGTRIQAEAPSFEGERFTLYMDQRMSYLVPGTLLMFPDPTLVELVKNNDFNADLQDALGEIGNNLVGSLKRIVEPLGIGEDLVQGETVWEPNLLAEVERNEVHLRGLLGYRKTKLMMLLTVPSVLLDKLSGN